MPILEVTLSSFVYRMLEAVDEHAVIFPGKQHRSASGMAQRTRRLRAPWRI
ncbi:MAG: hypothetical protein ACPL89_12695 [Roseiflexus castenholzii]